MAAQYTKPTEREEQAVLCKWLDLRKVVYTSVPNEGKRSWAHRNTLAATGLHKGFPDLLIFSVPVGSTWKGVAIEMKRQEGRKPTAEQLQWLLSLESCGWLSYVAFGADMAIEWLKGHRY